MLATTCVTRCSAHVRASPRAAAKRANVAVHVQAPSRPAVQQAAASISETAKLPTLISRETVRSLEAHLDDGAGVQALRRFNDNLSNLTADNWRQKLRPVFNELAHNLESFNPAFTAVLLKVQCTIGQTDYVRRDLALKNLIQPLAGEYGMHNNEPQAKTHRELFSEFYQSLFGEPLENLLGEACPPEHSVTLFSQMMRDIMGNATADAIEQATYAMGYNLAIEYLADYEKTWMLDSFRALYKNVLSQQGMADLDWVFLEIHAEGEAEHAAIGHSAVLNLVPHAQTDILRKAMLDHDRDFAVFYNKLADMLE